MLLFFIFPVYFQRTYRKRWSSNVTTAPLEQITINNEFNKQYMSRLVRKPTLWFLTRLDTNRAVQPQKKTARSMEFCIYEEEGLYYASGESKCADQIRCHHEADPQLCFRTSKVLVFSKGGSCFFLLPSYEVVTHIKKYRVLNLHIYLHTVKLLYDSWLW